MFLNEATLLDNIKNRYYKDKIYVSMLNTRMTTRNHDLFHRLTSRTFSLRWIRTRRLRICMRKTPSNGTMENLSEKCHHMSTRLLIRQLGIWEYSRSRSPLSLGEFWEFFRTHFLITENSSLINTAVNPVLAKLKAQNIFSVTCVTRWQLQAQ